MSWTAFRSRGETPRNAPKHRTTSVPSTTATGRDDTPSEGPRPDRGKRDFVDRIKAALAA